MFAHAPLRQAKFDALKVVEAERIVEQVILLDEEAVRQQVETYTWLNIAPYNTFISVIFEKMPPIGGSAGTQRHHLPAAAID